METGGREGVPRPGTSEPSSSPSTVKDSRPSILATHRTLSPRISLLWLRAEGSAGHHPTFAPSQREVVTHLEGKAAEGSSLFDPWRIRKSRMNSGLQRPAPSDRCKSGVPKVHNLPQAGDQVFKHMNLRGTFHISHLSRDRGLSFAPRFLLTVHQTRDERPALLIHEPTLESGCYNYLPLGKATGQEWVGVTPAKASSREEAGPASTPQGQSAFLFPVT